VEINGVQILLFYISFYYDLKKAVPTYVPIDTYIHKGSLSNTNADILNTSRLFCMLISHKGQTAPFEKLKLVVVTFRIFLILDLYRSHKGEVSHGARIHVILESGCM